MKTMTILATALGLLAAGPAFGNCKDHRPSYGARKSLESGLARGSRAMTYHQEPAARLAGTTSRRPLINETDSAFGKGNNPAAADRSVTSAVANGAIAPLAGRKKAAAEAEAARTVPAPPESEAAEREQAAPEAEAGETAEGAQASPPAIQKVDAHSAATKPDTEKR